MERELVNKAQSETTRGCLISGKGGEKSLWANLPNEILSNIFSRLFGGDRAVFRCVCRSWEPVIVFKTNKKFQLNNTTSLTCLSGTYLMYPNGNKIIHPISDEFHHVNLYTIPGAIIHAEKGGWFLMTTLNEFFFFNPLTNEKVHLPEYGEGHVESAYISEPPTSPNWMVIVSTCVHFVVILTLKCGEKRWSLSKSKRQEWFNFTDGSSAVVCNGLYYFLGKDAQLLIHDPKKNSFRFYEAHKSIIYKQLRTKDARHYLLESDGKVLAVFVSCDGNLVRVCRWDAYKKMWEALESLGDNMLFVSLSSSICERATVRGTGNKIYFPRLMDDAVCFYSLSTKKYHTFSSRSSYKSFEGLKNYRNPIWIKL